MPLPARASDKAQEWVVVAAWVVAEVWAAEAVAVEAEAAADDRKIERRKVKCREWTERVPPDRDP